MIAVAPPTIVVLGGDQTGQELLIEALRVIAPEVIGLPIILEHFDLSLEKRRATKNEIVLEAAAAMKRANSAGAMSISSRKMRPVSCPTRPSVVSRTARGCS